jgi:hypothetical protein
MGRFARDSRTIVKSRHPAGVTARPQFAARSRSNQPQPRRSEAHQKLSQSNAPARFELKYFVLALAALVGLGVGWLAGKAVTGWLPAASPPLAVAERATPPIGNGIGDSPTAAQTELRPDAASPQAAVPNDAARQDEIPPADTVAQATGVESESRAVRRGAGRVHLRRQARGGFFFKPFKALRRLRIW